MNGMSTCIYTYTRTPQTFTHENRQTLKNG